MQTYGCVLYPLRAAREMGSRKAWWLISLLCLWINECVMEFWLWLTLMWPNEKNKYTLSVLVSVFASLVCQVASCTLVCESLCLSAHIFFLPLSWSFRLILAGQGGPFSILNKMSQPLSLSETDAFPRTDAGRIASLAAKRDQRDTKRSVQSENMQTFESNLLTGACFNANKGELHTQTIWLYQKLKVSK